MSTEERNWDLEAAEYVLGTVTDETRIVYDKLYEVDSDWRRRVHRWQSRLDPLHGTTSPVQAPGHVLTAVLARIHDDHVAELARGQSHQASPGESAPAETGTTRTRLHQNAADARDLVDTAGNTASSALATLNEWRARVRYWQLATVLAMASLVGVIVLGPGYLARSMPESEGGRTVAVLQGEQNDPLWIISYQPQTEAGLSEADSEGQVSVTVVGSPEITTAQTHQLWMVLPEGSGVRSVGLVPSMPGETVKFELPIPLEDAAEFAVSLEPLGGVPGPEHGPVVTRTFIIRASSGSEA